MRREVTCENREGTQIRMHESQGIADGAAVGRVGGYGEDSEGRERRETERKEKNVFPSNPIFQESHFWGFGLRGLICLPSHLHILHTPQVGTVSGTAYICLTARLLHQAVRVFVTP